MQKWKNIGNEQRIFNLLVMKKQTKTNNYKTENIKMKFQFNISIFLG